MMLCAPKDFKRKYHRFMLGGLAADVRTKKNGVQTNQMSALLLNERPRTIAETMATATE